METTTVTSAQENLYVSSTKEKAEQEALNRDASRVSHDEFLQLLTAQLTQQDPLNPMDDAQFIGQMAQMQTLDEQIEMTNSINGMRLDNQLRAGAEMMGMMVEGLDINGTPASGEVTSVVLKDKTLYLDLDTGYRMPYASVSNVQPPEYDFVL